jgi:hypothetical protein
MAPHPARRSTSKSALASDAYAGASWETAGMSDAPPDPAIDDGGAADGPDRGRRQRLVVAGLVAVVVVLAIVVIVLLVNHDDDSTVTTAANPGPTTSSVPVAPSGPGTASSGSTGSDGSGGSGGSAATGSTASTGSGGASATSVTTAAPGPAITSFTSSSTTIACPSPDVSTTLGPPSITLSWTTERATGVDLSVDGGGVYASYGPSGSTTITVPCDGGTHTYTLTAKAAGGQSGSQTISVQTRT